MVLLQDENLSGVSFWYPLGWKLRGDVRVIPWSRYKRGLAFRGIMNLLLFVVGLSLLFVYTETRFNCFATLVLLSSAARLWIWLPQPPCTITLRPATTVKLMPSVLSDYSGALLVNALLLFIMLSQDPIPEFTTAAAVACAAFLFFAAVPLIAAMVLVLRR